MYCTIVYDCAQQQACAEKLGCCCATDILYYMSYIYAVHMLYMLYVYIHFYIFICYVRYEYAIHAIYIYAIHATLLWPFQQGRQADVRAPVMLQPPMMGNSRC